MKLAIAIIEKDVLVRELLRDRIATYVKESDDEACISTFTKPSEFEASEYAFHLLITDTEFEEEIEDEVAWIKHQRDMFKCLQVIYVSAQEEKVFEVMETQPIAFVRKKKLDEDLERAWNTYRNKKRAPVSVAIIPEGRKRHVYIPENIISMSSKGHYIDVRLCNGENRVLRGKLSDMEGILSDFGFVRVHTSYLINIRYIEKIDRKKIFMKNDTVYKLSEKYIKEFYKRLAIYLYE